MSKAKLGFWAVGVWVAVVACGSDDAAQFGSSAAARDAGASGKDGGSAGRQGTGATAGTGASGADGGGGTGGSDGGVGGIGGTAGTDSGDASAGTGGDPAGGTAGIGSVGSSGSAGSNGSAASGGSAGSSGSTGSGGSAATGGIGTTGSGGSMGSAGSAGRGGSAGSAGSAGSGGTNGASGSAGRGGSGGTAGGGGTAGSGGTGGVAPRDPHAYVLWSKPDIARIWTLDKTTGNRIAEHTLSMTTNHGTGWSARDFDALRDGTRRLVWTRPAMGETLIWILGGAMERTAEIANTASDPKQGWFSVSYARLADGKGRLLWFNTDVATAVLWPLGTADTYDGSPKKYYTFTSGGGVNAAAPVSYAPSPDGTARILWNVPNAGASIWHLDPLDDRAAELPITLPRGYAARSYSVMDTGRVRIGLGDDAAGSGLVCTFRSDGTVTDIPAPSGTTATGWGDNQCYPFGPEAGWTFAGYTVEDCGPGSCPAPCVDTDRIPHLPTPPDRLSKTGLYAGTGTGTISPRALAFEPAYELWSDGAVKTRHAYIPKCAKIETSDMDHWSLPVGSRFWKQFRRDGVLVETRLIHRFGPGPDDWIFASYQWQLFDPSDALLWPAATGVQNANGTQHDIPSEVQCRNCHTKLAERILSFSAIQLTHNRPGVTMASLSNGGRLTVPNAAGFPVPGSTFQQAALGYLHANCGNCHNSTFAGSTLRMRLLVGHRTVQATDTYTTATNVPTTTFACNGAGVGKCDRIEPNNPAQSAIIMRMSSRVPGTQMPPLGTELVHTAGINAVSDWIIGF